MDHTICHFEIPADDLKRASAFYSGLFGRKIEPWSPDGGEAAICMVETVPTNDRGRPVQAGVNGMLIQKKDPQHPFANDVGVESVDANGAKAVSLGAEIAMPKTPVPGMGCFLYIKDPEGNIIGLWEDNSSAGTP